MEGETEMILSENDGQLFYQLWFPLLGYASCAFGFVESASELVTPSGVDAIVARMAADELWNHVEIIDDYLPRETTCRQSIRKSSIAGKEESGGISFWSAI